MDWKKVLIAAVGFAVLAQVIHTVSAVLTMSYYVDPAYFAVWSKVMMPGAGAPPATFYYYSIAAALVTGALYAIGYSLLRKSLPGKGLMNGVWFGALLYAVAGVPMTLTTYLMFNVPVGLLLVWNLLDGLVLQVAAGVLFARVWRS